MLIIILSIFAQVNTTNPASDWSNLTIKDLSCYIHLQPRTIEL
jgi:hypothetical protein